MMSQPDSEGRPGDHHVCLPLPVPVAVCVVPVYLPVVVFEKPNRSSFTFTVLSWPGVTASGTVPVCNIELDSELHSESELERQGA
jgi:hypothetical protein